MKSVWSGSLVFGLVNIPVKLYSATYPKTINFKMICKKHELPVHYKRICEKGEEVKWNELARGFEIKRGTYIVLQKKEIERLKPKTTDVIEIIQFTDKGLIDHIYFNKAYYLIPNKKGEKAYYLFKEVLIRTGKVAIGRFVMKDREHIAIIESYKDVILLTTLHYDYEVKDTRKLEELKEVPKLNKKEIELAELLVKKYYSPDFDIKRFKDSFVEELKRLIKLKFNGKEIKIKEEKKKREEKNLIEALKASIAEK